MLRNKVSRVRPNVEKQHGVVRSDCVTLPAFRVTYALQPRGADRVDAFGADDLRDTGDVLGYATGVMEGRISLFTNWRP